MSNFNPELYQEKYRIASNRLPGYDYSSPGEYFITICTQNMVECFGQVINNKMILNKYGKIARENLLNTREYFNNVLLDEFVVMPNHVHVIFIIINKPTVDNPMAETIHELSLQYDKPTDYKYHRRRMLIPKIVGKYKMQTSKQIHQSGYADFAWQPNYYDHVIRDERSLNNIREYIRNNPRNWNDDRNNVY